MENKEIQPDVKATLKEELVKFCKWYQIEEMQRTKSKLFTLIVDDYLQNFSPVLPQTIDHTVVFMDNAWPLTDVLDKLIFASEYLLHEKNYDGGKYEEIEICVKRAKEIKETLLKQPLSIDTSTQKEAVEWISVEERLPSESGEVLTVMENTADQYISFYRKGRNVFEVYGLGRVQPVTDMKVTYWQPLPQPPTI